MAGDTVLVTGANSGIGFECARQLAREGGGAVEELGLDWEASVRMSGLAPGESPLCPA